VVAYAAVCPTRVGRDDEVAALRHNAATRRLTLISGPAGIGKSRLVAEAVAIGVERGYATLSGYCTPEQSVPFAPFVRALRRRTRTMSAVELDALFDGGAALAAALVPEVASAAPKEIPPQADLFAAMWLVLARLAGDGGAVLVLEDLHWADADTLGLLAYLARESDDLPVWIVGTFRGDELHRRHLLSPLLADLGRERRFDELALHALHREELRTMIERILDGATVGDEFLDAMHERTGGNPFFVEELLKVLIERGDVYHREGVGWDRRDLSEIELPSSVRETLLARVRTMAPADQEVLHLAALQGERVDASVLAEATGADRDAVDAVIADGLRLQLLVERDEHGHAAYAFRHSLTREALGDELVGPERRSGHLRLAHAIERVHGDAVEPLAAELADHYAGGGDVARAVEWGRLAARAAAQSFALEEASRRYEAVLSQMSPDAPDRLALLHEAYTATIESSDRRVSVALATEARRLARARGDRAQEARAVAALAEDLAESGATPQSVDRLREALELVHGVDDAYEATVLASLCRQLTRTDHVEEATERMAGALELARATGNAQAVTSLNVTAMMNASTEGGFDAALEQARGAARSIQDELGEFQLSQTAGYICLWRGRFELGSALFERALELKQRVRPIERYTDAGYAWLLSLRGEYDHARALAEDAIGRGSVPTRIVGLTALAEVADREGGDVASLLEELMEVSARTGESQRSVPVLAVRARRAMRADGAASAAPLFWEVLDRTTSARGRGSHWPFSMDLAAGLLAEERHDELARWAAAVGAVTASDAHAHNLAAGAAVTGLDATARGEWQEAGIALDDAAARFAAMPCPARLAEVRLFASDLAARRGDAEAATAHAQGSLDVAAAAGASALADAARRFLARAAARTVFATMLFTDIVGSTAKLADVGDVSWRSLRDRHDGVVRREVARFGGREVATTGDGFLTAFDSPSAAVRTALALRDAMEGVGVEVRLGLHSGECQAVGEDLVGIAVHVAARVCAAAGPGEILATSTVRELTMGGGFVFEDRGTHELKGVPEPWHLFAL